MRRRYLLRMLPCWLKAGGMALCLMGAQTDSAPLKPPAWLERLASYENIVASFAYHAAAECDVPTEVSSGTIMVSGSRYRLEMADQLVVCDGECVWTYFAQAQEVQLNNVDAEDVSPWLILQQWPKHYTVTALDRTVVDGVGYECAVLLTKTEAVQAPAKVELVFCDASTSLVEMRLYETLEDPAHCFEITEIQQNVRIDPSSFSFVPEAYSIVETIDMRQ